MPRKSDITTANLVDHLLLNCHVLTTNVGTEVGVETQAASHGTYPMLLLASALSLINLAVGKWNLTAQEIEQAYEAPSVSICKLHSRER